MAMRLYGVLMHLVRLAAWPLLWWLGRRVPAFREHWNERVARVQWPASMRNGIVVHAVSMGEVSAALPLVEALLAQHPELPLTFTCTTPTASALIRQRLGRRVFHVYLPFDTPGAVRRFVGGLSPRLLVLMETELWPGLVHEAHRQGALVVLANARLSERSARRHARLDRWTGGLMGRLLSRVDLVLAQDATIAARFAALGMAPARIRVTGSLKNDSPLPPGTEDLQARLRAWADGRPVWLAASTHQGEEAAVLAALPAIRRVHPAALLVLVPRHPQRFDAVAGELAAAGVAFQRATAAPARADHLDVLLVDTMGELRAWMGVAQVVFMGGTLVPVGGHNPLEAMQFGTPVLAGPHRHNFAELFEALESAQAVVSISGSQDLADAVRDGLSNPAQAQARGARGLAIFLAQGGATERSMTPITALLARLEPLQRAEIDEGEVWLDPGVLDAARAHWFDPRAWQARGEALGHASGRGTAWFLRHGVRELVLRHYHRGGLMGRLVRDRFLAQPTDVTRAMSEHALLRRMRAWGLPVPRPVAARVRRVGLQYTSDILVERVPGSEDLAHRLAHAPLGADRWSEVGATLARLHAHGIHHSDLNCHNLLIDDRGCIWIIDFDKCEARPAGPWMQANLDRLLRSLRKERSLHATWCWGEQDWLALQNGYQSTWKEFS